MEGEINVEQEENGDILILKISGRLDAVTSPKVEQDVAGIIDGGRLKILMNFGGVNYLSSAGMRMLLATTKKLKTVSGALVVTDVTDNVMDVLKMSGFDRVIPLAGSQEEGLQQL